MAEVLSRCSHHESYEVDEDDNNQEITDSPGALVLDGPYAHVFLANFQRDLQQSVNAGKKAYKNNKRMSYKPSFTEIEEPPKHEPPAKPLPADNLKSCLKKGVKKEGKVGHKARPKVTWAPGVYDPTPSADCHLSNTMEWPKGENKNKKSGKNQHDTSDALHDVSNKAQSSKGGDNRKSGKKGGDEINVVVGGKYKDKGGKHKDVKNQVEIGTSGGRSHEERSIKGGGKGMDKKWEKKGKGRGGKHSK